MDYKPLIISLFFAFLLVIGGTAVVKKPSILSNYNSYTEEERSSSAFLRYLKDIRKAMCVLAVVLVVGALLDLGFSSKVCFFFSSIAGIPAMAFYLFYSQSKVSERMKRKSRIYAGFLLVVLLVFPVILLSIAFLPVVWGTSVRLEDDTLHISGVYGEHIPCREMRSVSLEDSLPTIAFRSNGLAVGNVRKGNFRTIDGRNVKLFLSSDEAPYLRVQTIRGEDIYINMATTDELHKLYFQLSE